VKALLPNNSPLRLGLARRRLLARRAEAAMQGPEPVAGIVALADKVVPTEDLPPERQPRECCLSYGAVPFEPLRERMLAQPETFWDDRAQAKENVLIARPFHDNLGVNKVIFLFSDTGARPQVFQLPMWEPWKAELLPIFAACKLQERQVVRCLLARMPPGGAIPPHHDNGKWVSQTHRVHIPIVTSKDVHFSAGPTFDNMRRYAFNPVRAPPAPHQAAPFSLRRLNGGALGLRAWRWSSTMPRSTLWRTAASTGACT